MRIVSVAPSKDFALGGANHDEVKLHLRLGDQLTELKLKGPEFGWKNLVLFKQTAEEKLIMRLYGTPEDEKVGYAEILLTPLVKIPDTRHEVTVHCVYRHSNLAMEDKESAVVELEIIYTEKFSSSLEVQVIEANLTRNTELFGKMDPYVKLQVGEEAPQLTKVKEDAGIHPKWDEVFHFDITNPMLSLRLTVMDKDISNDDTVGEAVIPLRASGYLEASGEFTVRDIPLKFKDEEAGILRIATRYNPDHKK